MSSLKDAAMNGTRGNDACQRVINERALNGFSDVDRSDDPHSFITYLDKANSNEQVRLTKQWLITDFLKPLNGDHILDVGCGVGHDARRIGKLVGRSGRVVGVDRSKTMIREAQRRIRRQDFPLEFLEGDVHHLDFRDSTFDGCLVISTLMHLMHPRKALAEMVRVLKSGGRLAAFEPDWDTLVVATGDTGIDETIVNVVRRSVQHSGIGHRLPVYLRQAGLADIRVQAGALMVSDWASANDAWRLEANVNSAINNGTVSAGRLRKLLKHVVLCSSSGTFFGASTGFAAVGTKP
jgi:SAM-dependent methyltransferase